MNVYTVRDNLKNTIAGKEKQLEIFQSRKNIQREPDSQMAMFAAINFLEINIDELKRILVDVEACCAETGG